MKNFVIAVCVVLCGGVMSLTSCTDMKAVNHVYDLRLDYEQAQKDYDRINADTMALNSDKDSARINAEEARKEYLRAYSRLGSSEKQEYKALENSCQHADESYLGSEYEENKENDQNYHRLEACYTRYAAN